MIFTTIVWCLLVIVMIIIVVTYETSVSKQLKSKHRTVDSLPEFSMNLEYRVDPVTIDNKLKVTEGGNTVGGDNQYDCNALSLHKCDINDARTLFGCRELMVKCQHFDADTPYIDANSQQSTIIPKNSTPTEGYALAIRMLADSCNPYHGDLVLVALTADSNEYMMICSCKNPGYVGNDHMLGNCTTLSVCNGRVVDINKPLNELECACAPTEKNVRYEDGAPVCKQMTVKEANEMYPDDWSHIVPWSSNRRTHRNNFNATIRGNLRTRELLDPCLSSAHDTRIEIPNASRNDLTNECNLRDYGYPIQTQLLDDTKWKSRLPKVVEFLPNTTARMPDEPRKFVDGVMATGKYDFIRMGARIDNHGRVYAMRVHNMPADSLITKESADRVVLVPPYDISMGKDQAINITANPKTFIAPKCTNSWPSFTCEFAQAYGEEYLDLPIAKGQPVPGAFLWNYEHWEDAEFMVDRALSKPRHDDGVAFSPEAFTKMKSTIPVYGLQWSSKDSAAFDAQSTESGGYTGGNGVLVFKNQSDFTIHDQTST